MEKWALYELKTVRISISPVRATATTATVLSATSVPAVPIGRLLPTTVSAAVTLTSIQATGTGTATTVRAASPCVLSSKNDY